jgi:hypothetical protein
MTEKLMVGEIQLCYFTFCESTRNQSWKKIKIELIRGFKDIFEPAKYRRKDDWWNVRTIDRDFDATLICHSNVKQIEALAQRWMIRIYYPFNRSFDQSFMVPFIKIYCNPEGSYLLEKVALEMII